MPDQPFGAFPLEDGAIVLRFNAAPDPDHHIEVDLTHWIALQNPDEVSGAPLVPLLARMFDEVKSCISILEEFLP